ncbi:MAG: aldose epimerase family protein [Opitutales bacterium]
MKHFGTLPDGRETKLYTLSNKNGMTAEVSDFGATLVALSAPDRNGDFADLTLGFDSVEGYASLENPYFGATAGRVGNRIAHGRFSLDGKEYQLANNNDPGAIPCHLHGGNLGFSRRLWSVKAVSGGSITLEYVSPDGEEGYPGTLTTSVTYSLNEANELTWEASAATDAPTILNLVHHSYWNLSGRPGSSIHDHILQLQADHYLPTDSGLIPTGELSPVADTPMDFTRPTPIGERIAADFEALKLANGYDHCWVLAEPTLDGLAAVAKVHEPKTGRTMEVFSNQPGVQFYAGNFLDPSLSGKGGASYSPHSGFCLETENFPDAPNQPGFPSAVLRPGETYRHIMVHRFSAK